MVDATRAITGEEPKPLRSRRKIISLQSEKSAAHYVESAVERHLAQRKNNR
jgi:hypothetical protein